MVDQEAYQAIMREAASAAWDRDWERATAAYQRATQLAPDDPQACVGLANSLMEVGRLPEALQAYERVNQLVPGDPMPLEKMALILENLNRTAEAAKRYAAVGELYFSRKDLRNALPNWEQAVQLDPDLAQPHLRLAVIYEQNKDTRQLALYEYLALARLLQKMGQAQRTEQSLQRALQIDPTNADARGALSDFRKGLPLQPVTVPRRAPKPAPPAPIKELDLEPGPPPPTEFRSPVDEAAHYALGLLADLVWSGEVPPAGIDPLVKAIDLHQIGAAEEAIERYEQVLQAGLNHPALSFNLGMLYAYTDRPTQASTLLALATTSPDYGLASNLLLGQVAYNQKDVRKSAEYLVEGLRRADMMLNERVDTGGYDRLISGLAEQPVEYLNDLSRVLLDYLDDAKWREKMKNALSAQSKTSYVSDLIEMMIEGGRPEMAAGMERIDQFLSRNMLMMALDEAQLAIEKSPDYLPTHCRVADILVKEGRTQEAALKLNLVANVYRLRGNEDKAADLFMQVVELWPPDMLARQEVIGMLKEQGRVTDALRQYADMADFHYRMLADSVKASEVYLEALDYGKKNNADATRLVPILKALADIENQQLNTRKALNYYEQVLDISADDQETQLAVIDLSFQVNQPDRAIAALDAFARSCIAQGDMERLVSTLEGQARLHPNEVAVRQRLADVYRQQGRLQDAIAQMDAIGEVLLDAGRMDEAVAVVRQIIELNPPDIEGYRRLLEQLQGGGGSS